MDEVELYKSLASSGSVGGAVCAVIVVAAIKSIGPIVSRLLKGGLKNDSKTMPDSEDFRRLSRVESRLDELGRELERLCKEVEKEREHSGKELHSLRGLLFNVNSALQRLIGIVDGR